MSKSKKWKRSNLEELRVALEDDDFVKADKYKKKRTRKINSYSMNKSCIWMI